MRIICDKTSPKGYTLYLSKSDTYKWASRPGKRWPCSTTSNKRLCVCVDSNGLCDLTVNGKLEDINGDELEAIVTDHLPQKLKHLWPVWEFKE